MSSRRELLGKGERESSCEIRRSSDNKIGVHNSTSTVDFFTVILNSDSEKPIIGHGRFIESEELIKSALLSIF